MTVRSYLVVHPRGTLLWDTGIDDTIADLSDGRTISHALVFKVPRTLRSQLAELDLDPSALDFLGPHVARALIGWASDTERTGT
jgi:N-acyl homoserine lactone hydrolase